MYVTLYCKRFTEKGEEFCRFHFPRDAPTECELVFERLQTKDGKPLGTGLDPQDWKVKVVTARNHPRINDHNPLMSTFWGANTDLQCVVDAHACVEYCCKYSTKGEKAGEAVNKLINEVSAWGDDNSPARSMIKKIMMIGDGDDEQIDDD